ncbi:MAG: HAD-IA family hydrolase [Bacteroidales bacterium]|nr:HAD-IA family hydrolase [Bacteroidales bacterium]
MARTWSASWKVSRPCLSTLAACPRKSGLLFTDIFLSFRMKLSKPGKEIFLKVLEEAGIEPQESLFIDDAPANIETAAQLGFKTLLYDVNKNLEEELNKILK